MRYALRSGMPGFFLAALVLPLLCSGCTSTQKSTSQTSSSGMVSETAPSALSSAPSPGSEVSVSPFIVPYYPPPAGMDLCGEPVPLNVQEVAERFDKEFTLVVYNHAQVYLWLKRMDRYFPWIEERLRYYKLPDDLKYVAIVESDLLPNACSPKGAAGPWQFMAKTGCSYGLDMKGQGAYDERFDFERATDCAFRYLQDLDRRYKNWALAIACYNCGDKRITDQMRAQKTNDYYQMKLPVETERYVFRVLAVKAVLSNPAKYGYNLPPGQGYGKLRADRVTVKFAKPTSIQTVAEAAGTSFREIKRLNPTLRADDVPAGTYDLKVPKGSGNEFKQNLEGAKVRSVADEPAAPVEKPKAVEKAPEPAGAQPVARKAEAVPKKSEKVEKKAKSAPEAYYTVKKGDTLSGIAHHNKLSVEELKKLNKIKGSDLSPGQKLRVK